MSDLQNDNSTTVSALQHQKNEQQKQIEKMQERIALLEKETQTLKKKLNPNKSKLLENVVKAKKQHDELLQDLQEQRDRSLDKFELMTKRRRNQQEKISISLAVKFAQEKIKSDKSEQAKMIKKISHDTKQVIRQQSEQHQQQMRLNKFLVQQKEQEWRKNYEKHQKEKLNQYQQITNQEKKEISKQISQQEERFKALESYELLLLSKLNQSKSQEQVFKNQIKDAMYLSAAEYEKKYGRKKD